MCKCSMVLVNYNSKEASSNSHHGVHFPVDRRVSVLSQLTWPHNTTQCVCLVTPQGVTVIMAPTSGIRVKSFESKVFSSNLFVYLPPTVQCSLSSTPTMAASPQLLLVPPSSYSSLDNNRCLSLATFITTLWYNAMPVREFKFYCVYHSIAQNSKRCSI